MVRQPVTSSMFTSIGHEGNVLEVEFKGGKVYRHYGVTADHHADLLGAESIGKHYNAQIKGKFDHEIVPQDDVTTENEKGPAE